jgi:hypothetical protein
MSPLCKEQLERLRKNFDGNVHVFHDWGDKILVIVDTKNHGPFTGDGPPDRGARWMRIEEPTFVLIDPSRADYPRVVN